MAKGKKGTSPGSGEDLSNDIISAAGTGSNAGHSSTTSSTASETDVAGTTRKSFPVTIVPSQGTPLPKSVGSQDKPLKKTLPAPVVPEAAAGTDMSIPMFQGDPETDAALLHDQRVKAFGADYVVTNKGKATQVWTRQAWNAIRGDKGGWKEAVQVPKEVRELGK